MSARPNLPPVTSDRSPRARSPRGQGSLVRDELVAAAEDLLREKGSADAVSVADVVGRVGVTPPVLYAHFEDKADLFRAVHRRRMTDFRDTLRRAARRSSSPLDALEKRGRAYIRYATTKADSYRALFMSAHTFGDELFTDPAMRDLTAYDDLVRNIQDCMDSGEVPPGDVELLARVAWTQVHGVASMLITMPVVTEGVGRERLVGAALAGVVASLQASSPLAGGA
jgi:AcrR family transcriptional regulator